MRRRPRRCITDLIQQMEFKECRPIERRKEYYIQSMSTSYKPQIAPLLLVPRLHFSTSQAKNPAKHSQGDIHQSSTLQRHPLLPNHTISLQSNSQRTNQWSFILIKSSRASIRCDFHNHHVFPQHSITSKGTTFPHKSLNVSRKSITNTQNRVKTLT